MSLRNRNRSAIKTGYTHNVFQTPNRGLSQARQNKQMNHSFINIEHHSGLQPEIVHCSLTPDNRGILSTSQNLNAGKNVSFEDSTYKPRLTNSQSFQNRKTQRETVVSTQDNMTSMRTVEEDCNAPELSTAQETQAAQLTGCNFSTLEFLVCKFLLCLIQNDEKLLQAKTEFLEVKFDVEQRLNLVNHFSPVSMFQRIDRAGKGHITRDEVLKFLNENGFKSGVGYHPKDLNLIMKAKIDYQSFVRILIDTKQDSASVYFNQRALHCDQIIRKIDKLPERIEQSLCKLLLMQLNLVKEANFYRQEIKKQKDFNLIVLFKEIAFEDQNQAAKRIHPQDVVRFFRVNGLLIDDQKVHQTLFARIIGQDQVFDYKKLHKLLTGDTKQAIVFNPAVQVSGLNVNHRRTIAHKQNFNQKMLSSLTAPKESFILKETGRCHVGMEGTAQPLRDRRYSQEKTKSCDTSCRLGKAAHTKCFRTDHIPDQQLVSSLQDYLRDQLLLDEELESIKIKLANERDFYPKYSFDRFLTIEDGAATALSIYQFICDHPCEEIGSIALSYVEEYIAGFTTKKYAIGGRQNSDELNQVRNPLKIQYHDFLDLIAPMNRDFTELMLQRQLDLDMQEQETNYIVNSVLNAHKKGEIPPESFNQTRCRVARPHFNFMHNGQLSHVPVLISQTLLNLVLNHQRNKEIRRTYEKATKGKHMGSEILRFLPNSNSDHISASEILRFVALNKAQAFGQGHCHGLNFDQGGPSALSISKRMVSRSRSKDRSPLRLICQETSTVVRQLQPYLLSPTLSERQKMTLSESKQFSGIQSLKQSKLFMIEKSCEKEVKFLAQRFGSAMNEFPGTQLCKKLIDQEIANF